MDRVKRLADVALAGGALVLASPLLGALALAVKLDSPGPVFFRQTRVGRGKRPITTLKLRTMVSDAASRGPLVTAGDDPRITRVGRWLRRSKLDELPQLWNVVRGDMSLVGPRPEVPRYVDSYRPEWAPLLSVRPGLTDLASLVFRDEESLLALARDRERAYREVLMPMKAQLAMTSIERASLRADLSLLVRTALAVLRVRDAQEDALVDAARRRIEELNAETT